MIPCSLCPPIFLLTAVFRFTCIAQGQAVSSLAYEDANESRNQHEIKDGMQWPDTDSDGVEGTELRDTQAPSLDGQQILQNRARRILPSPNTADAFMRAAHVPTLPPRDFHFAEQSTNSWQPVPGTTGGIPSGRDHSSTRNSSTHSRTITTDYGWPPPDEASTYFLLLPGSRNAQNSLFAPAEGPAVEVRYPAHLVPNTAFKVGPGRFNGYLLTYGNRPSALAGTDPQRESDSLRLHGLVQQDLHPVDDRRVGDSTGYRRIAQGAAIVEFRPEHRLTTLSADNDIDLERYATTTPFGRHAPEPAADSAHSTAALQEEGLNGSSKGNEGQLWGERPGLVFTAARLFPFHGALNSPLNNKSQPHNYGGYWTETPVQTAKSAYASETLASATHSQLNFAGHDPVGMTADWGRDSLPQDERGVLNGIPSVTEPSQFPRYFQTEAAAMPEGGPAWLYAGWQQRPHAVLDNILVAADRIALYDALRATSTDVAPQLLILAKSTAPIGVEALQALVSEIELGKDKKKGKRGEPSGAAYERGTERGESLTSTTTRAPRKYVQSLQGWWPRESDDEAANAGVDEAAGYIRLQAANTA